MDIDIPIFFIKNLLVKAMDIDILSRLPVKSLLRFRCVSKFWKALISEPYFKKMHRSHAKNPKMLISQYGYDEDHPFTFYSSSLSSIQFVTDVQRLDWPLNSKPSHARVCCCCDGLFLVGIWGNLEEEARSILLLWNPSTRESIVLSNSELPPIEFSLYGLGYDCTINDYKVVRIDEYTNTPDEILILKSGFWKKIDESSYRSDSWLLASRYNMDGLAFVHGALHWLGCDPTYTVVSFNISNEMFGEIPLPPKIRRNRLTSFIGVSVSGGMLCSHCIKDDDQTFSLWIMKDYDIKESWIKSLTIRNIESSTVILVYRFTDGEMLFFRATAIEYGH